MSEKANIRNRGDRGFPKILPVREQSNLITELVRERLDTVLPVAMREAGLDMWMILCQEDDLDPVYKTMIPIDCWCPILQMLIFVDEGDGNITRTAFLAPIRRICMQGRTSGSWKKSSGRCC